MRKITIELTLSPEVEAEYYTKCAEFVIYDLVQQTWCAMKIISDSEPPRGIDKESYHRKEI